MEILTLMVMALGGWPLGGDSVMIVGPSGMGILPREIPWPFYYVRTCLESSVSEPESRTSPDTEPAGALILDLAASNIVRN